MAGGRTLTVALVANTNSFRRGMMSAVRDAQGFQGKMTALGASMRGMVGPALAAAGAAVGAFALKLGVDGVKAAVEEERAVASLAKTLANVGQAFAVPQVETFIDNLQFATGVADSDLRPAFQRLVTATQDVTRAQDMLRLALDISAGTGRDLQSVTMALSKAAGGQFTALRRLGVPLDDATIKSKDLGAVMGQLSKTFSGQAATAANTYEGQIKRLSVAFDELQESFGKGFLAGLGSTADGTDDLEQSIRDLQPALEALGTSIGEGVRALGDLTDGVSDLGQQLDVPVNKSLSDFSSYLVGLPGLLKTAAAGVGLFTDDTVTAAEAHRNYRDAAERMAGTLRSSIPTVDEFGNAIDESGQDAEQAAQEFDLFTAAISRTNAVMGYQKALDDLKGSLKDNGKAVSIFTNKGRENVDALIGVAEAAKSAMESTDSQAQKALYASSALDTLTTTMANTKMDEGTKAALLAPFQALLDDLQENGVNVDSLQRKLDALNSKTITVTTKFVTLGDGSYFGSGDAAGGAGAGGSDGGDKPKKTRSASPVSVGTLIVNSAPGERAEESVPRSLRRLAFVAGLGV